VPANQWSSVYNVGQCAVTVGNCRSITRPLQTRIQRVHRLPLSAHVLSPQFDKMLHLSRPSLTPSPTSIRPAVLPQCTLWPTKATNQTNGDGTSLPIACYRYASDAGEKRLPASNINLNQLSLLSIEHELIRQIDIKDIISMFAVQKAGKCIVWLQMCMTNCMTNCFCSKYFPSRNFCFLILSV